MLPREIQEWAKDLIENPLFDAKIRLPPAEATLDWDDRRHCKLDNLPDRPGRPASLNSAKNQGSFPKEAFGKPLNQAMLLHFFANHELLATEAMALILLRFPETPASFQKGLIQTITDEQKHFRLYRDRIRALGFDFGDFGTNEYLWNVCRAAASPLEFVTFMSLTFEQANLDYAVYFQKIFEKLNIKETAEILATVYRDETKHVQHGLVWFNQWRPQQKSDWDEYQEILVEPLSPARAKGLGFQSAIRHKLGFSARFVKELSIYQQSKGRPADVWWFNPGAEAELQNGRPSFQPNESMQDLAADLSSLLMLLAKKDDIVMVDKKPSSDYLLFLADLGFLLPEFISDPAVLLGRKLGLLKPWAVTPRSDHMPKNWGLDLKVLPYDSRANPRVCRKSWSKQIYLEWCERESSHPPLGTVCQTMGELNLRADELFKKHDVLVAKSDFNCSGRGSKKLLKGRALTDPELGWLKKQLHTDGCLTVEPWVDKVTDMSTQIMVQDDPSSDHPGLPKVKVLGTTRFITDEHGQYRGHYLGDLTIESPPDFWRWYHEHGYGDQLKQAAIFVGERLHKLGYRGPAGVDALVFRSKGVFRLYPIVEVNTRWTMGSLALILNRKIPRDVPAKWLHISYKILEKLGFSTFVQLIDQLNLRCPLKADGPTICSGVVPTTDPALATRHLSMLLVGEALGVYAAFNRD